MSILVCASFFAGKFLFINNIVVSIILGVALSLSAALVLIFLELSFIRRGNYELGLKLEEHISNKLSKQKIEFKHNIIARYGDLDFLVKKNNRYYGVEAKNEPGIVIYENNALYINNFDRTDVLGILLSNCSDVRNSELGTNSGQFVNPILVFGFKTAVNIPQNVINFKGHKVVVTTINDLEKFLI